MKSTRIAAISMLALAAGMATSSAFAAEPSQAALMAQAKVSESQARTTALARVPLGVVKGSELEEEHGRLIWSFDIARPSAKGVTEIQVDARTGAIASVKNETPSQEAKEAQAEETAPK